MVFKSIRRIFGSSSKNKEKKEKSVKSSSTSSTTTTTIPLDQQKKVTTTTTLSKNVINAASAAKTAAEVNNNPGQNGRKMSVNACVGAAAVVVKKLTKVEREKKIAILKAKGDAYVVDKERDRKVMDYYVTAKARRQEENDEEKVREWLRVKVAEADKEAKDKSDEIAQRLQEELDRIDELDKLEEDLEGKRDSQKNLKEENEEEVNLDANSNKMESNPEKEK